MEESHRHHSHLAGITPFETIDPKDPQWKDIVKRSLSHWLMCGPALWSGWCVPWASMIHTRVDNAGAAELWLEIWQKLFTNEAHGTLHDVNFSGFSLMGRSGVEGPSCRRELMQMDAGMSAVAAIQEMLLHVRRGVTVLFKGAPPAWRRCGFDGMRTDGAFLVSATRTDGRIGRIKVTSRAGGRFRLENPWTGPVQIYRAGGRTEKQDGRTIEVAMKKGETVRLMARSR